VSRPDPLGHFAIPIIATVILVAVLILGALGLAGCGNHPGEGVVQQKKFIAAHYDDWWSNQCFAYGKYGQCTFSMPIEHHDYVPDDWELKVKPDSGKAGWVSVTKDEYDNIKEGDYWNAQH
jgi:hypothetical protein